MNVDRSTLNVAEMWGREDIGCDDPALVAQIEREARLRVSSTNGRKAVAALSGQHRGNGRIAAIVPNYNYGHFIEQAIDSLLAQTKKPNQIIVVDDASTDDSLDRLKKYKRKVKVVRHERNSGTVGQSRNTGIQATDAEFVICLDSDDMLDKHYVEMCHAALKHDPAAGVAYTGVQSHVDATGYRVVHKDWPIPFNWQWQTTRKKHPNTCIPTASMFRRRMWERAGGYDGSLRAVEDAEFWVRALGTGYRTVKCTAEPLFIYRKHGASMSSREPIDLGWINASYRGLRPLLAPTGQAVQFRDYTRPLVSVIIPVGPGHERHVITAIQSVVNQTLLSWELIVINNSGERLPIGAYPFVKLIELPKGAGVSRARNVGIEAARGALSFFLDADDAIQPQALERMARSYSEGDAGYVYSGWWLMGKDGGGAAPPAPQALIATDYDPRAWLSPDAKGIHGVTVLAATEDLQQLGGFDENAPIMEDWEFFARCAAMGLCGKVVKEALLVYRADEGKRRREAQSRWSEAVDYIKSKFAEILDGRKKVMGCCGGNAQAVQMSKSVLQEGSDMVVPLDDGNAKTVRFTGPYEAPVTYFGKYSGCKGCPPVLAANGDWQALVNTGAWEVVEIDQPLVPLPAVIYPLQETDENSG